MRVKTTEANGITVSAVEGEINITTSPDLKKSFESIKTNKVVIDMQNVAYIDSSGLATLVELLKKVKQKGGNLSLSQVSEKVKSLFEITKLDRLFSIYPSNEAAIDSLK